MKYFSFSFLWGFFQWFFSGIEGCGFSQLPTFGLKAWKQTFFFDFSMTFVGAGMICSHLVNLSLLLGAVLSYGLMWPLLDKLKGSWFPMNLDEHNIKSVYGYKVFLSVAIILGDGLYTFVKIIFVTIVSINARMKNKTNDLDDVGHKKQRKDLREDENFLRDKIPMWLGVSRYLTCAAISTVVIPLIFPQLKWYYVFVAYIFAPSLAFCNAYGAGLTEINMAYNYGKIGIFVIAAVTGIENGVVAGLAGCGLIKSVVSVSCVFDARFQDGSLHGDVT